MVLIGHSMGGLMSRLAVTDSGDALWRLHSRRPIEALVAEPEDRDLISASSASSRCRSSSGSSSSPRRIGGASSRAIRSGSSEPRSSGSRGRWTNRTPCSWPGTTPTSSPPLPRRRPFQHRRARVQQPLPDGDRSAAARPLGGGAHDRRQGRHRPAGEEQRRDRPLLELAHRLGGLRASGSDGRTSARTTPRPSRSCGGTLQVHRRALVASSR